MESNLAPWNLTATAAMILLPFIIFFFFTKKSQAAVEPNLPPGPKKLPIIGNIHQISLPPFACLRDLAKQYGPLMHLKLGEVDAVVVSSPEIAKQVLKDDDPIFANRAESLVLKIFWYDYADMTFTPHGKYWMQMRKICAQKLLAPRSVRSFASIREDEVSRLVEDLRLSASGKDDIPKPVNLTEKLYSLISSITCRVIFGKVHKEKESLIDLVHRSLEMGNGFLIADLFPSSKIAGALSWRTKQRLRRMRREMDAILDDVIDEHERDRRGNGGNIGGEDFVDVLLRIKESGEMEFSIGYGNIKGLLLDMYAGGTETSASTLDWAMVELLRNPGVMAKAQAEVRQAMMGRNNTSLDEEDIQCLNYIKLVIMETHRLHPQGSILPRFSREPCHIGGYSVPKSKLMVNLWAIHRDPKYWVDPETFKPERFQDQPSLDYTGSDTQYLPFGTGRRVCPGIAFATASVELPLAHLLYSFDWKLPDGVDAGALNMTEEFGLATSRKEKLFVVVTPYLSSTS